MSLSLTFMHQSLSGPPRPGKSGVAQTPLGKELSQFLENAVQSSSDGGHTI